MLDAIDAYVKAKGRVGLFQDIVGSKRGKARASVADLRDFLSREGLGTVKIEAATDAGDELNFVSSSRARRGTKQSQKKARLPRDAEQGDLASYLVALAGAPKRLTATQLGAALIDAKRRASRALEVASQALALRGAASTLHQHQNLEEWSRALDPDMTGKVSKATLIESLMRSQPALQAAGDPAKLAASLQADAILAFAAQTIWMPFIVALTSSAQAYSDFERFGPQLTVANNALTKLENLRFWWESLSLKERRNILNREYLVEVTEANVQMRWAYARTGKKPSEQQAKSSDKED